MPNKFYIGPIKEIFTNSGIVISFNFEVWSQPNFCHGQLITNYNKKWKVESNSWIICYIITVISSSSTILIIINTPACSSIICYIIIVISSSSCLYVFGWMIKLHTHWFQILWSNTNTLFLIQHCWLDWTLAK